MNDEIFEISLLMNIEYIFSKLIYKENISDFYHIIDVID